MGGARGGEEGGDAFLIVATVRRPHGVRGDLSVSLDTDRADAVFRPGRTLRLGDPQGVPRERTVSVRAVRPFKGGLLLTVEGVGSREEADALRGHTLLIPASEAEPPAEGELFHHDLVGLEVVARGESVGVVRDVLELPAGETLVVRRRGARDLLVPYVASLVREVDLEAKRLHIEPPEGLLEL